MSFSHRRGLTNEELEQLLLESDNDDYCYDEKDTNSEQQILDDDSDGEQEPVEEVSDTYEFLWEAKNMEPTTFIFNEENSGCKSGDVNPDSSVLDFFQIFISPEIMEKVVGEMNRYAEYVQNNEDLKTKSRVKQWFNTTTDEMYVFMALAYLMPRVKKLKLHEYWSTNPLIKTKMFSDTMPRDRYINLLKMIHFCDNTQPNRGDSLFKIRLMIIFVKRAVMYLNHTMLFV